MLAFGSVKDAGRDHPFRVRPAAASSRAPCPRITQSGPAAWGAHAVHSAFNTANAGATRNRTRVQQRHVERAPCTPSYSNQACPRACQGEGSLSVTAGRPTLGARRRRALQGHPDHVRLARRQLVPPGAARAGRSGSHPRGRCGRTPCGRASGPPGSVPACVSPSGSCSCAPGTSVARPRPTRCWRAPWRASGPAARRGPTVCSSSRRAPAAGTRASSPPPRRAPRARGHAVAHRAAGAPRGLRRGRSRRRHGRRAPPRPAPPRGYDPARVVLFRAFDPAAAGHPDVRTPTMPLPWRPRRLRGDVRRHRARHAGPPRADPRRGAGRARRLTGRARHRPRALTTARADAELASLASSAPNSGDGPESGEFDASRAPNSWDGRSMPMHFPQAPVQISRPSLPRFSEPTADAPIAGRREGQPQGHRSCPHECTWHGVMPG